ncbi:MAG TPA: rRNA maturation RNase YbeY [Armatimonadota bacterium]|nr:rRNA maturation RNase YbeY [Armatimonadota bacterium]HOP79612.1 rRNA maturation RNase YbeY [Armatimonadota bacterium]
MNQDRLRKTAQKLLLAQGCPETSEVSVLLTDDAEITVLNRNYLGKDRPTDVISFYQAEKPEERGDILGDVVISVETAKRQADERRKSLDDELDLLLAHGILHLLGYTDYTEEEARQMQELAAQVIGQEAAR